MNFKKYLREAYCAIFYYLLLVVNKDKYVCSFNKGLQGHVNWA